jgi:hypothetical protein
MRVTVDAEAVGEEEVIRISLASGRFSRGAPDAAGPDDAPARGDAGPSGGDDGAGVRASYFKSSRWATLSIFNRERCCSAWAKAACRPHRGRIAFRAGWW